MSEENRKDFQVVKGDGKELDISTVYDHIKGTTPKDSNKKENIIVPKGKKEENK